MARVRWKIFCFVSRAEGLEVRALHIRDHDVISIACYPPKNEHALLGVVYMNEHLRVYEAFIETSSH